MSMTFEPHILFTIRVMYCERKQRLHIARFTIIWAIPRDGSTRAAKNIKNRLNKSQRAPNYLSNKRALPTRLGPASFTAHSNEIIVTAAINHRSQLTAIIIISSPRERVYVEKHSKHAVLTMSSTAAPSIKYNIIS